jgi:hypothetical protein
MVKLMKEDSSIIAEDEGKEESSSFLSQGASDMVPLGIDSRESQTLSDTIESNSIVSSFELSVDEANVTLITSSGSQESLESLDGYANLDHFVLRFSQCIDDIQTNFICRSGICAPKEEDPLNKPSLLYRSRIGRVSPSNKLRTRATDSNEQYLNKFIATRKVRAAKLMSTETKNRANNEGDEETMATTALARIRSLVNRKSTKNSDKRRRRLNRKQHGRDHDARERSVSSLSTAYRNTLGSVIESPRGEVADKTPKHNNQSFHFQSSIAVSDIESRNEEVNNILARTRELEEAFSIPREDQDPFDSQLESQNESLQTPENAFPQPRSPKSNRSSSKKSRGKILSQNTVSNFKPASSSSNKSRDKDKRKTNENRGKKETNTRQSTRYLI